MRCRVRVRIVDNQGSVLALHLRDSAGLVGLTSRAVPALTPAPDRAAAPVDRNPAALVWSRAHRCAAAAATVGRVPARLIRPAPPPGPSLRAPVGCP